MPNLKNSNVQKLYILSLGGLFESLSYYGLLAILVLYLTKVSLFSDSKSYSFFGIFTILAFSAPLLGGLVADQLLGYRKTIILGAIFLIIGNLLLFIPLFRSLCFGLAFIICGTGLYKANCTSLVGTLYKNFDSSHQRGYTLFYTATNVGAMSGPIIYGITTSHSYWIFGFIISAICIFLNLLLFLKFFTNNFYKKNSFSSMQQSLPRYLNFDWIVYFIIFCTPLLISYLFYYDILSTKFIPIYILAITAILLTIIFKQIAEVRRIILSLMMIFFFAMFFFAITLQVFTSINIFIDRNINHHLGAWNIPTIMFSSLYPMAVIIMAPMITSLWKMLSEQKLEPTVLIKIFFGLILAGCGFICFALAATESISSHYNPLILIVIGNLFLGTGELCIMPSILSAISRFAPKSLQGTLMGALFLFIAFAGYLSSAIAKLSIYIHPPISILMTKNSGAFIYSHFFKYLSFMALGMALLFLMLIPLINLIMKEKTN